MYVIMLNKYGPDTVPESHEIAVMSNVYDHTEYSPDTVPESHATAVMSNVCEHTEYLSTQLEHKPL